jgi:DNA polymerase IV (archaeal DinB-like DNA polymerase)
MQNPKRQPVIFHTDLDAFYVSAEVSRDRSLQGLPVVVGADPETGRGVVVACSYEARSFGLRSGMPISRAWKLCPGAVYLRPDFEFYEKVSERVMETLRTFAEMFEQVGIDEAFLDVTDRVADIDEARELAIALKKVVLEVHGLTCSVGIGPNKSSAKIASDREKPDGLTIVPLDKPEAFLAALPVSVITGVGRKTQEFLTEHGIETIGQLQALSGRQLMSWFGKSGVWLWGVVHAQENIPVRQRTMPKSLSVERTFDDDIHDFGRVYAEAGDAAKELADRIKKAHLRFRIAGAKIRFEGFETHTREKSLTGYTDSEGVLDSTVKALLREFEGDGRPVRLIGVRVAGLSRDSDEADTLDSWAAESDERQDHL